ncbi:hypothetical protein GQX74_005575 [Glossina fuscipes]|nr:hypothetical protein GQX74_005575 [Glossina fuscipes]
MQMNKDEEQQSYSSLHSFPSKRKWEVPSHLVELIVNIILGLICCSSYMFASGSYALLPLLYCFVCYFGDGMHHGLLCHTFGFVGFQIHGFTFYFSFNLIKAWKARMAARKYQ